MDDIDDQTKIDTTLDTMKRKATDALVDEGTMRPEIHVQQTPKVVGIEVAFARLAARKKREE